jgi:L-arabinose isomerase
MKPNKHSLKIGLFGIGLKAYWAQFEGLKNRLEGYTAEIGGLLSESGAEVVNLGLVDTPEAALDAGHAFRQADVDLIFLYVTTYALSSTVLPAVRRARVPVIVLNLQPEPSIDYARFNAMGDRTRMTGEWLAYCSSCSVPEIANVFRRSGVPFFQVTGVLRGDERCRREIADWVLAARVVHGMEHNRLGLLGHYYNGMLDIASDTTLQTSVFGGHMEIVEAEELVAIRREVGDGEARSRVELFREEFTVLPDCPEEELLRAARTSVALDTLVAKHHLGSMAYYHMGEGCPEIAETMSSVILGNSLLTARGVPVAGEYEVKNAQAMKIMDLLGAGGSFTEYYAMDFRDDVVLMGHDGPGHPGIAQGRVAVRPLEVYHGKIGCGVSVEMQVKHGPVTVLSVVEDGSGGLFLLVAEGESVPGPILEIGNTNSRYKFPCGARDFVEGWNSHGPAHHCAVGAGHQADRLAKVAGLLRIRMERVC